MGYDLLPDNYNEYLWGSPHRCSSHHMRPSWQQLWTLLAYNARHIQSLALGPNAALHQILTGPRGLIHKMNRIRLAASIVAKCVPTDIHLTKCGPPGKISGHPWLTQIIFSLIEFGFTEIKTFCQRFILLQQIDF